MFLNLKNLNKKEIESVENSFKNNKIKLSWFEQDNTKAEDKMYVVNLHDTIEIFTLIRALNESGHRKVDMFEDNCFNRIVTVLD